MVLNYQLQKTKKNLNMDSFTTFNTGNRKKFLDQAKKKKQQKTSQSQYSQLDKTATIIQKNIRYFLNHKSNTSPASQFLSSINYTSPSQLANQLQTLSKTNTFLFNILHKKAISEISMMNNFSEEARRQLYRVLAEYGFRINGLFGVLTKYERMFWVKEVLGISDNFSFVYLNSKQVQNICAIVAQNPLLLVQIFTKMTCRGLAQQLINLIFSNNFRQYPTPTLDCLPSSPSVRAYQNITNIISQKSISYFGEYPTYFIKLYNTILITIYDDCIRQLMKKYKIDPILLKIEGDLLQQIIEEKQQWVNFMDFLNISNTFNVSAIRWFIQIQRYQDSVNVSEYLTTVLRLMPMEYPLQIQTQSLMMCFRKVSDWIKTHEITDNEEQQKLFLPFLYIINRKFFQITDKQFILFAKKQGQTLQRILRDKFFKIIYKLILTSKTNKVVEQITKICVNLLEQIYNKIFRTGVLSTQIFVNQVMSKKLTAYTISKSDNEVSQFVKKFPFIFSLKDRAIKFSEMIRLSHYTDMEQDFQENYYHGTVKVRRGYQFEDAFSYLGNRNIKKGFKIVFINKFGEEERGVDAGGLTKEFINRVLKAAFRPQFGMFIENSDRQLLAHPQKAQVQSGIIAEYYEFIGKIIGKALYQGITIGPKFCGPFLNAIIGKKNNFDDLSKIDKQLYNSLTYIKTMQQDASQLCLTFQYRDQQVKKNINLRKQGKHLQVTNENKNQYISLLANYKVNKLLQYQSRHIRKGLRKVINSEWLFMFNYQQLNYLISGSGQIKIKELRNYTRYVGYQEKDITIVMFWKVVEEFDQETKSDLLMFVTSCPRPSFLGFQALSPPFTILKKEDKQSLPISHTCSNILELPDYKDIQVLESKLKTAIKSCSGFDIA